VGAHSDDGKVFSQKVSRDRGMKFSAGDTVGVGLRLDDGDAVLFFTKNGKFHCWDKRIEFFRPVRDQWIKTVGPVNLYPVVGIDSNCPVEINNGSAPFKFDVIASKKLWKPLKGPLTGTAFGTCIEIQVEDFSDIESDDFEDSDESTYSDDDDDDIELGDGDELGANAFFTQLMEAQDVNDDDDDDDYVDSDAEDDEDD